MKRCPFCGREIREEAIKCRFCRRDLRGAPRVSGPPPSPEASPAAWTAPQHAVGGSFEDQQVQASTPATPEASWPPATASPAAGQGRVGEGAIRFSHSGYRYILGFGADFFGIWDREVAGGPLQRYPRTDQGWSEAWRSFTALEPNSVEVSR